MVKSDEHETACWKGVVSYTLCDSAQVALTKEVSFGVKVHILHRLCVAFQCPLELARLPIPDLDCSIF